MSDHDTGKPEGNPAEIHPNQRFVADGIGFPVGMAIEQLIVSIRSTMTLYEVWRDLNLERNEKRTLLERLGLLNHAVSQLTQQAEGRITRLQRSCRVSRSETVNQIRQNRNETAPKMDHVLLDPPIYISEI